MEVTAEYIIMSVEKRHPKTEVNRIRNFSDLAIDSKVGSFNQYIIGLTAAVPYSNDVNYYIDGIKKRIIPLSQRFQHDKSVVIDHQAYAYSYPSDLDDVTSILGVLSAHYKADLNIDEMVKRLKTELQSRNTETFFLVVVIVTTPMLLME